MAKKVAASMKAAWVAAKRDFSESPGTENLKQDVIDVLDFAKNKATIMKRATDSNSLKTFTGSGGVGLNKAQPKVNQDVGSELLSRFKDEWGEIHNSTESSSLEVSKMESDLHQVNTSLSKSHGLIKNSWEEFSKLKEIVEALDEALSKVDRLGELIQKVEEAIHQYSLTKAELDIERRKHSLKKQHEKAIADNTSRVEQMKKVLANEQQLSLTLKYELESKELKERQSAFQEIFNKQMEDYRKKGEVDQPINEVKVNRSMSQLEEVELEDEDGQASLHEFLSDVVLEDKSEPQADPDSVKNSEQTEEKENISGAEPSEVPTSTPDSPS